MSEAENDDLLARAWMWIRDLRAGGHAFGCRGSEILPPERREPCNCGRDGLLNEISAALAPPKTTGSGNGHAL